MELQTLDQQLKVAIQNHQILVAKMKSDPQNGNLQKMLHDLQSRIRTLSERQKQVVQQLRKDLEIKKQQATTGSDGSANNNNNNHPSTVVTKGLVNNSYCQPPTIVNSLPQQVMPLSLTMKQMDSSSTPRFTTILLPAKVTLSPAPCIGGASNGSEAKTTQLVTLTTTLLPPNSTPTAIIYRPPPPPPSPQVDNSSPRLAAPPAIRVPQYPPIRPNSSPHPPSHSPPTNSATPPSPTTQQPPPAPSKPPSNTLKPSNKNNTTQPSDKDNSKAWDPDLQKTKFMLALGLVTHDVMTELKSRKSERKRRTTANPQFSYGNWDHHPEKKSRTHYLASTLPAGFKRPRGRPRLGSSTPSGSRPSTPEDHIANGSSDALSFMKVLHNGLLTKEENVCVICRSKGELMSCSLCLFGYHSACLQQSSTDQPPSITEPSQPWICPNCLLIKKKNNQWPRSLAMVHSYILHKTVKEEEKRQLVQRGVELRLERDKLEQRSKQLTEELSSQRQARNDLLLDTKLTLDSIEQLKTSVRLLQTS